MKKFFKSGLSIFLVITIIFSSVFVGLNELDFSSLFEINANAASIGDLTFNLNEDGKSFSVSFCNESAEGEIVIPGIYHGLPVTCIDTMAFYNCKNLISITIPNSVNSIGDDAFYNCSNLASITIPDGVSNIGYATFENCTNLKSLTIPDSVISIDDNAFYNCTNLTSIIIPDSVTSIGKYAFYNCTNLTSFIIPYGVTSIGECAFYNCKKLESIVIPDTVTDIGVGSFSDCTSLTSIRIPDGIICIGEWFPRCTSLISVSIPDSVTSIGNYAFVLCTNLMSLTIPNSVTSIGRYAFSGCTNLTSVAFPDGVTFIGDGAFSDCNSLFDVYYSGSSDDWSNISIGSGNSSLLNATVHYNSVPCSHTSSDWIIDAEASCTVVGSKHKECTECGETLETGVIPATGHKSSVWIIDKEATCVEEGSKSRHCLICDEKIDLAIIAATGHSYVDGICTTCGNSVGMEFLSFKVNEDGKSYSVTDCDTSVEGEIVIPNTYNRLSVTSIDEYAFGGCTNLTSIVIPDSVKTIRNEAFRYCNSLTSITIPDGVTNIDTFTFSGCTSLRSITIPDSVTCIGSGAFSGCKNLTSIKIPNSVISINDGAFAGCTSFRSITIPDGVLSIGGEAFNSCTSLTSITIPDSVTSIGYSAFYNCTSLTSVILPKRIASVKGYTFYYCTNLTSITISDNVTSIAESAFGDCTSLKYIFFGGDEEDKNALSIYEGNSYLQSACWHYTTTDHVFEDVVLIQVSCISNGLKYKKCTFCDYKTEVEDIPATGHTAGDYIVDKNPGCTEKGSKHKECTVCKIVLETAEITALGHTASNWITDKKATVNAPGSKHKECVDCYEKLETAKIKQLKCATPKLKSATNVATGVKFSWNKVSGADNYEIYRKTGSGKWTKIATVKGSVTSYTDKTAKSGTTYKYTVKAKNEAGLSKYNTAGLTIKCIADPVLKTPTSAKAGITLKWSKVTGAQGYVIYRKAGSGKFVKLTTVKGVTKVTYTDKKAKKGTKYTYKLKAYSGKTYSEYSNAKTIKDKY